MMKRDAWGGWRGCLSSDNPRQPPVANPLPATLYALLSVYAIGCRFRKVAPGGPFLSRAAREASPTLTLPPPDNRRPLPPAGAAFGFSRLTDW
jgi:hypothetical protein